MSSHTGPAGLRLGLCLAVAGLPLPEYAHWAHSAERAGFGRLCVGESQYDAFVAATLVAGATATSEVMTAVTTWTRPPVTTALGALAVDEASAGRFVLGLGTMPAAWNRDFYGIDPSRPVARMREYVAVLRQATAAAATTDGVQHEGEFHRVLGWRRQVRPIREWLPIHLAATRPAMARLAGEVADGVLLNVVHTWQWLAGCLGPALDETERRVGRRIERGVMVRIVITDGDGERDRARADVRAMLGMYQQVPYFREIAESRGLDPDDLDDRLVDAFALIGPAEQVRQRVADYAELVDWVELTPVPGLPPHRMREGYERLLDTFGSRT